MTRNLCMVECIGTTALISHWQISGPRNLGHWRGLVLGNDAVIVARELRDQGLSPTCRLLDPTSADLKSVASALRPAHVASVGGNRGARTRSLCIEDISGRRQWIFSRVPSPNSELGDIAAEIVYVDYYPELVRYLNQQLVRVGKRLALFINLSFLKSIEEVPYLVAEPSVVQASILDSVTRSEAARFAKALITKTGAQKAFVTLGFNGAVLATGGETWYSSVNSRRPVSILGSGAIFSSEVITGILNGLDRKALLDWSLTRTAERLKAERR